MIFIIIVFEKLIDFYRKIDKILKQLETVFYCNIW